MKRSYRRLAWLAAIPLALVALVLAAAAMLPADRIARFAAERAEAALGRDVRIERVSLRVFPLPAVSVDGVRIGRGGESVNGSAEDGETGAAAEADAAQAPMATVSRVLLRPRILPLLRRRIVVDAITLDRPRVLLQRDPMGNLDLPAFGGEADEADSSSADIDFLIRSIDIRDGRFVYQDESTGNLIGLDGIQQHLELSGELRAGQLERIQLDGDLEIADLTVHLPEQLAAPVQELEVRIAHRAQLDDAADRLSLEHLAVTVQELTLEGEGTVSGLTSPDRRDLSLRLGAAAFDVGELIRSLPSALWQQPSPLAFNDGEPPAVTGRTAMDATIQGRMGEGEWPEVNGTIMLDQLSAGSATVEDLVTALSGRIAFSLDSIGTEGLTGRALGEPFGLSFVVHDPAAPRVSGRVRAGIDLARAQALGLLPDDMEASGGLPIDLTFDSPLLEPKAARVDGTIGLSGVVVSTADLLQPITIAEGQLALSGQELQANGVDLRFGESDLAVDLSAVGWLPMALGDSSAVPQVNVDARSTNLDADALLGVESSGYGEILFARLANRQVNGKTAAEAAAEAGFSLPAIPPVALDARLRADAFRRNGLDLHALDARLVGSDGTYELRDASFRFLGGDISIAARLDGTDTSDESAGLPITLHFDLRDVGAAPFFNTLTPFRDRLSGSMQLAGSLHMILDEHMLPLRESVAGEGSMSLSDGNLTNWPIFQRLGGRLSLAQFDTLAFRDWTGSLGFSGPTVALQESLLEAGDLSFLTAGSFDFAGALDIGSTLLLPQEWAERLDSGIASRLANAAADDEGRVPVGVRVTGTAGSPDIELDASSAIDAVAGRLRSEAEERARTAAERVIREAMERAARGLGRFLPGAAQDTTTRDTIAGDTTVADIAGDTTVADTAADTTDAALPPDSLGNAADSARSRIAEELKRRLRIPDR